MSPRKFSARRSGHSVPERSGPSRKALQLCRQVARTLDQIIAGELDDDALRGVGVHSVIPAPDESQLLVTVGPMAPGIAVDPQRVLAHLAAASGVLRSEVASAITRKKAPSLRFQVSPLPPGASLEELAGPAGEAES